MDVTGITVPRAQEIADSSVTNGTVNSAGQLVLTRGDGTSFVAGTVVGDVQRMWPVGSIFMNVNVTDPYELLGFGVWYRWGQGRVPVSVEESIVEFNTSEETGGEMKHDLTEEEIPTHVHAQQYSPGAGTDQTVLTNDTDNPNTSGGANTATGIITGATGGGQPHNNLQPYITVYMWKRHE